MLKSLYSALALFICLSSVAQDIKKDTIQTAFKKNYGLRVGTDLNRLARNVYDNDYSGFEIVADYRMSKNLYIAAEVGNEKKFLDEEQFQNTQNGYYVKAGIDYNVFDNWLDMDNMIYVGGRVAYSNFSNELNSYPISNINNPFFPPTQFSGEKTEDLSAVWLEFVAGFKVEVVNNLYLGVSARLSYLASNKEPENFENIWIPGYNKVNSGKFGVGFNYTISYLIPFKKK